jgi:dihydrodiol dehydrogenase / D-xylose 1-dehydrogenase (NADP)
LALLNSADSCVSDGQVKGKQMAEKIQWGIVGTGWMAQQFARGLGALADAQITAVSSRTKESAEKFAAEFNIPHRYVGIEDIICDKDVDIIYIATPHPMHKDETIKSLEGGKAVLCEKPLAMNSTEVSQMIACAKKKKLFLMEAMWMYFFPAMAEVRRLIAAGAVGEVRIVQSNICMRRPWEPRGRFFNPQLGGGALLDLGIYNIALAQMIYGQQPRSISSLAHIGESGVDEQSSAVFRYENGEMAVLTCAVRTIAINEAIIYGTEGYIRIPDMFWHPDRIFVKTGQNGEKEIAFECLGNGWSFEAAQVMRCLRKGMVECPTMPLDTSAAIMKTMDQIRQQWGLVYPMEKKQ